MMNKASHEILATIVVNSSEYLAHVIAGLRAQAVEPSVVHVAEGGEKPVARKLCYRLGLSYSFHPQASFDVLSRAGPTRYPDKPWLLWVCDDIVLHPRYVAYALELMEPRYSGIPVHTWLSVAPGLVTSAAESVSFRAESRVLDTVFAGLEVAGSDGSNLLTHRDTYSLDVPAERLRFSEDTRLAVAFSRQPGLRSSGTPVQESVLLQVPRFRAMRASQILTKLNTCIRTQAWEQAAALCEESATFFIQSGYDVDAAELLVSKLFAAATRSGSPILLQWLHRCLDMLTSRFPDTKVDVRRIRQACTELIP